MRSLAMNLIKPAIDDLLDRLVPLPCGYQRGGPPAAEPTALAVLALCGGRRFDAARVGASWLASVQSLDGRVPPLADLNWPAWPTPLAVLAVLAARNEDRGDVSKSFDVDRATQWLLTSAGKPIPTSTEFGHDGRLIGWSWAAGTHAWVEPTAWSVLALKALGLSDHRRTREGVKLLVDRLLSTGGCNYGNTVVLGQRLRSHIEPTGLTLLALADETIADPRIDLSLRFLQSALSAETTPISLAYGLLGLAAFERTSTDAADWLVRQSRRVVGDDGSPLKLALLAMASQGASGVLIRSACAQRTASLGA
ncbi:MAG: hypothetical protein IT427_13615 [Pirellulales bacterium]|nr:hypothetical protein [Pirellulales bacterium]